MYLDANSAKRSGCPFDGALQGGGAGDAAADFVSEAAEIFLQGGSTEGEGQGFCDDFRAGRGGVGGAGGCGCGLSAVEGVCFGCGGGVGDLGAGLRRESEGANENNQQRGVAAHW